MPFNLAELYVFPLFLVFCRVGAAFMIFPGISDPAINLRARLIAAGSVSLILWPIVLEYLPSLPSSVNVLIGLILAELMMGILLAAAARTFMSALSVAGETISFSAGLSSATLFDPNNNINSSAVTLFLLLTAGAMVFATNTHHLLIEGVVESYAFFPPGQLPELGDALSAYIQVLQNFFIVGLKISAPVVVVGFLMYVMFGIFNRLIPNIQVFFVALPATVMVGLFVLTVSITSLLFVFLEELQKNMFLFDIPAYTG